MLSKQIDRIQNYQALLKCELVSVPIPLAQNGVQPLRKIRRGIANIVQDLGVGSRGEPLDLVTGRGVLPCSLSQHRPCSVRLHEINHRSKILTKAVFDSLPI